MKYKQVCAAIRKALKFWVAQTGLSYWQIDVEYSRAMVEARIGGNRAGYCEAEWQYQKATITFYPYAMTHLDEKQIEAVVVHELMHIFLNEMREGDIDHEERCATQLAKAFLWVKGADK